jgi:hypothetical protein
MSRYPAVRWKDCGKEGYCFLLCVVHPRIIESDHSRIHLRVAS